jgi:hypothetical protein
LVSEIFWNFWVLDLTVTAAAAAAAETVAVVNAATVIALSAHFIQPLRGLAVAECGKNTLFDSCPGPSADLTYSQAQVYATMRVITFTQLEFLKMQPDMGVMKARSLQPSDATRDMTLEYWVCSPATDEPRSRHISRASSGG